MAAPAAVEREEIMIMYDVWYSGRKLSHFTTVF